MGKKKHDYLRKHSWMQSKYGLANQQKNNFTTPKWNGIIARKKNCVWSENKPEWEFLKSVKAKKQAINSTPDCDKLLSQRK